jgi:glycosyltransferase involved in cell wall biosynthesis
LPPDVSVVIPVRNGAAFVREAIDSVRAQARFHLEIIVVDNASEDGTARLVRDTYGDSVKLAREERPGAAAARNHGVVLSSGRLLAFLDADDVWTPDKLAMQTRALEENPESPMVFGLCQEFLDPGLTPEQRGALSLRPDPYRFLAPSAFLLERALFLRAGFLPELAAGEFIAWYGWARTLGLQSQVVDTVCVRRRVHLANSSRTPQSMAGYAAGVKWLLDQRRKAGVQ